VGDVQEELEDDDVVVKERALELVDVFEAAPDGLGGDELVDPRREDVLVVRAVEDADHAARGNGLVNAPEKIVACFEGRWDLEGGYVAPLGIDAGEDVADRAVFAGGIHSLEDDEQRPLLAGIEDVLQAGQLLSMLDEDGCCRLRCLEVASLSCSHTRQFDFRMWLDEVRRL